jgi:uncharacterized membrane protein YgcG
LQLLPDILEENRIEAAELLADEAVRTRAGFSLGATIGGSVVEVCQEPAMSSRPFQSPLAVANHMGPDPGAVAERSVPVNKSDADFVRAIVPELAHMSDAYLTQHSIDRLQKYVILMKKQGEERREKNIEARLAQNLETVVQKPITINHSDNRSDILHPACFLPGAAVPMERLWLEARKLWGREPMLAVCEFDMLAIGLPGCIPAKAWEILHFPGSRELTLKLFSVANVARASEGVKTVASQSEDGLVLKESLRELSEMAEFRTAFRNLRIAAQLVRPWDYSFLVVESFLISTDYMEAHLAGYKRAPILAGFIDHIFRVNASNWMQSKPFMDTAGLKAMWDPWWSGHKGDIKREESAEQGKGNQNKNGGKGQGQKQGRNGGNSSGGGGGPANQSNRKGRWTPAGNFSYHPFNMPPPDFSAAPSERTICREYNNKTCPNTYNTCVKQSKFGPFRLYHLCNHVETKNGQQVVCAGKHAQVDHK